MSDNAAGWQPDPTGKHDHRYWDGTEWTENVADAGVASTDPYEAPTEPAVPAAEPAPPAAEEPTVVTPVAAADTTSSWPAAPPAAPPPYVPPTPAAGGDGTGDNKRGLIIGGVILAAVAAAVIAFLVLGGDDDEPTEQVSDESEQTTTTEADDGDEETLEDLEDACADGDFTACDDLYYSADLGSELEEFGSTCGGIADPQSGSCEATNGGQDADITDGFSDGNLEDIIADTYKEMFGLSDEQAECLAQTMTEAVESGELTEDQAFSEFFDYLEGCDISLEDLQPTAN